MASSLRSKFSKAFSLAEPATDAEAEKYKLRVSAGGTYNEADHKTVLVNTEEATYIENEFIRAKINVRVKGFRGWPSTCPSSAEYFAADHEKDMYSLGFSFVPKKDLPSVDTVWGNDLDHPIRNRIPPGFNTAFRIVKEFIDPGLSCDVYADEPWLYGPSLSCWFAFRIGDKLSSPSDDFPSPPSFSEGADGFGQSIRSDLNIPETSEKRRRHFLDASNREAFTFEKDRLYQADFFNPYIDFANFSLRLPGFSLKVIRYIGEKTHCLRYVFKNRETGDLYLNVNFNLLWGDQLTKAMEDYQKAGLEVGGKEVSEDREKNGTDGLQKGAKTGPATVQVEADDGPKNVIGGPEPVGPTVEWPGAKEARTNGANGTAEMRIHPGDHEAAAKALVDNSKVDEIDKALQETSTAQKRDGLMLDEID